MTTTQEVEVLAEYFEAQGHWRELKAQEHPDDFRNQRSAEALRELAGFVRTLSPEDSRIIRLNLLVLPSGLVTAGEEASMVASRIGFHGGAVPDPADSLDAFIGAALNDFRADPSAVDPGEIFRYLLDRENEPEALDTLGYLRSWLDSIEDDLVPQARAEGWSWQRIADALGRSKQAVWERHRNPGNNTLDE